MESEGVSVLNAHLTRRVAIVVPVVIYALFFIRALPPFIDEAYSFNLASDKSFAHMLTALREGADGSFPVYAILVNCWGTVFGSSEFSLRVSSAVFVVLFAWNSSKRLEERYGFSVAMMSVFFVLADSSFTYASLQARFYGLVVFVFGLAFWSTWSLIEGKRKSGSQLLLHAVTCGLLCLSHPLGVLYTAILASLYVGFSCWSGRFAFVNAASFAGGPALLLLWLPSFIVQRQISPAYQSRFVVLGWSKYWKFAFFDNALLFWTLFAGTLLVVTTRGVAVLKHKGSRPRTPTQSAGQSLDTKVLISYAVAFIVCLNGAIALLDGARLVPIYSTSALRYVVVGWVPYAVVVGGIFHMAPDLLQKVVARFGSERVRKAQMAMVLVGLSAVMVWNWEIWIEIRTDAIAKLGRACRLASETQLDLICGNHCDAFYIASRTPVPRVKYLLANDSPYRALMVQIAKYYPQPLPVAPSQRNRYPRDYVFLSTGGDLKIISTSIGQ